MLNFKGLAKICLSFFTFFPSVGWTTILTHFESLSMKIQVRTLTQGQGVIWGFDFLPDGQIIFTEREGHIKILNPSSGQVINVKGSPEVVAQGQGGLLDIYLHPQFAKNHTLYLTYSKAVADGATTALARARLHNHELKDLKDIFVAQPANNNRIHFGSRVVMDAENYLFISIGDRGDRDQAQNLESHLGTVLRLHEDGRIPEDNPFANDPKAKAEIWSYGHRNAQGLSFHPSTGELWGQEHGPRGGDEINLIKKGLNYGWPVITHGREYHGPRIGPSAKEGMEPPIHHWTPSIAPSGLTFYTGNKFPAWQGHLFSGALAHTHLNRLALSENRKSVQQEAKYLGFLKKRIRHVKEHTDGYIYLSTDDGFLLRLEPVKDSKSAD